MPDELFRSTTRRTFPDLRGRRLLLVASTGGHLAQLHRLAGRLGVAEDSTWLTFDSEQSRSLLAGRDIHYVPYVRPRDYLGVVRAALPVPKLLRQVDGVLSTGAGLALSALPIAARMGKEAFYLESVSRVQGPSLTGRLLARVPGVQTYTQHARWSSESWPVGPSILDDYAVEAATTAGPPRKVFVTLGTIKPYRFDRLVDLVLSLGRTIGPVSFRWQVGCTQRSDELPGDVYEQLDTRGFAECLSWADVTVSHAGVGSALQILDHGQLPILLPRTREHNEHVDNHQLEIFSDLLRRGLAVGADDYVRLPGVQDTVSGAVVTRGVPHSK